MIRYDFDILFFIFQLHGGLLIPPSNTCISCACGFWVSDTSSWQVLFSLLLLWCSTSLNQLSRKKIWQLQGEEELEQGKVCPKVAGSEFWVSLDFLDTGFIAGVRQHQINDLRLGYGSTLVPGCWSLVTCWRAACMEHDSCDVENQPLF